MSDRTGIAKGTLRPCVYFVRHRDMYAILAPIERDGDLTNAKRVYEARYSKEWSWCEATTLHEIDVLQKRLTNQEIHEAEKRAHVNQMQRDRIHKITSDYMMGQMLSSGTSEFEKDFIRSWFKLKSEKRDKYAQTLLHHNYFIMAREYDENKNTDDLLPQMPGQFERTASGGTPLHILKEIEQRNESVQRVIAGAA